MKKNNVDKPDPIAALNLFNEKVEKLIDSRFIKHIQKNGLKVSVNASVNEGVKISDTLPDQEAIDAFVLTIRFFIQDNESTSLRNMADIYNEIPLSLDIKDNFNSARGKLNSYLDREPTISLKWKGKNLTKREIFDTFIYGGLAHANPKKKIDFDAWMQNQYLAKLIAAEFSSILLDYLHCIAYIRKVNIKTLEELK